MSALQGMLFRKYRRKWKRAKNLADRLRMANRAFKREVAELRRSVTILEDGYIVEWCDSCDRQVTMLWDVKEDGCRSYCPYCGKVMMLCDSCLGECDFDYGIDRCKEMLGKDVGGRA